MFEWLLKLLGCKCAFVMFDTVTIVNKHGRSTMYARLVCKNLLCDKIAYLPAVNRKIHEEWIEEGEM